MSFRDFPWVECGLSSWEAEAYLREYLGADENVQREMRATKKYVQAYHTVFYVFQSELQRRVFFDGIADKLNHFAHRPTYKAKNIGEDK